MYNDLRYAFRMLNNNPASQTVAVLTLAPGIGANTAMFSVVNAVLLKPLPFPDPDRPATLWERNPARGYEQAMAALRAAGSRRPHQGAVRGRNSLAEVRGNRDR
jgi:putative ABC transport system permease protein